MTNLVTKSLDNLSATHFVASVAESPHYMFLARHISYEPDDSTVPSVDEADHTRTVDIYDNMLFGKRVGANDIIPMIPRYDWESDTVFEQYVHDDTELLTKNFFCVVNAGSSYHVYKCLCNNSGANSTVEPSGQDLEPFISPADGYAWKYMYTYSSSQHVKFATATHIPFVANTTVEEDASPGSVEVILVDDAGRGYNNFFEGEFRAQDLQVGGDDRVYGLLDDASSLDNFYNDCILKITSGSGINQYLRIIDYEVAGGQKLVTLEDNFITTPAPTDSYEVYPAVFVTGDGLETSNCVARALVTGSANTVSEIEILTAGDGFRVATAEIRSHNVVGVSTEAVLRPIVSPVTGHGGSPLDELGGHFAGVSIEFDGTESDTIPADNDWRQVGILSDPLFANVNVVIDFATQIGDFVTGETVYSYRDIEIPGTVTTIANSAVLAGDDTFWVDNLVPGDAVLITDGTNQKFGLVGSVANNTSFNLDRNIPFANTTSVIKILRPLANAVLSSSNTSTLVLDSCSGNFKNDYLKIVGDESSATVEIDDGTSPNMTINGLNVADFSFFVQLQKITGELSSGVFEEDEEISQNIDPAPSARLYNYVAGTPDFMFITNVDQEFSIGQAITGADSGAVFTPDNKYRGALKVDSGRILYLENADPISRSNTSSETIKIVLEF